MDGTATTSLSVARSAGSHFPLDLPTAHAVGYHMPPATLAKGQASRHFPEKAAAKPVAARRINHFRGLLLHLGLRKCRNSRAEASFGPEKR